MKCYSELQYLSLVDSGSQGAYAQSLQILPNIYKNLFDTI